MEKKICPVLMSAVIARLNYDAEHHNFEGECRTGCAWHSGEDSQPCGLVKAVQAIASELEHSNKYP